MLAGQHEELELLGDLVERADVPGLPPGVVADEGGGRAHGRMAGAAVPLGRTELTADWTLPGGSPAPMFDAGERPWPSTPGVDRSVQQTEAVALMTTPHVSAVVSGGAFFTPGGGTPAGLPVVVEQSAPEYGEMCQQMIDGTEVGSKRRQEVVADVKEAAVCFDWLLREHSDWLKLGAQIRVASVVRDLRMSAFAKRGKAYVQKSRCTVQRYERFVQAHGHAIVGEGYPPDADVLAWFVIYVIDQCRAKKARNAKSAFKGTSGEAVVKGLAQSHTLFKAPFPPGLLGSDQVWTSAKRPTDVENEDEEEAHAGAWVLCFLEELGVGGLRPGTSEPLSEVQIEYARVFALSGVLGLRTIEMERSRVTGVARDGDGVATHLTLRCAGGKASKKVTIRAFDAVAPCQGFTRQFAEWIGDAAGKWMGRAFMFRAFERGAAGSGSVAGAWVARPEAAESTQVVAMFFELLSMAGMTRERCMAASLTTYAMRHILPDVTRQAGWPLPARTELGRWAPSTIRAILEIEGGASRKRSRGASAAARLACAVAFEPSLCGRSDAHVRVPALCARQVREFVLAGERGHGARAAAAARRGVHRARVHRRCRVARRGAAAARRAADLGVARWRATGRLRRRRDRRRGVAVAAACRRPRRFAVEGDRTYLLYVVFCFAGVFWWAVSFHHVWFGMLG